MGDHLKEQVRKVCIEWKSTFHKMGLMSMKISNKDLTGDYVLDLQPID